MSTPKTNSDRTAVEPDYPTAVDYAFRIPASPITLTSIKPDAKEPTITRTFQKSRDARVAAIAWVTAQQKAGRNIYYQDCSVASVNKRPVKADVSVIHAAHVDVDVQGTLNAEGFAAAKAALLDKIEAYRPADPTCTTQATAHKPFGIFSRRCRAPLKTSPRWKP